jgi:hypothetical protein
LLALSTSIQANIIAGHDYVGLGTPQRQETNGKIEVVEFFSWGCPHCYEFYPMLARWTARLPKDVSFKRVPVNTRCAGTDDRREVHGWRRPGEDADFIGSTHPHGTGSISEPTCAVTLR